MLAGQRLFQGKTVSEVLAAVIRDEPDLSQVPTKVRSGGCADIGDAMGIIESTPGPGRRPRGR
jgi:hypothetical protein